LKQLISIIKRVYLKDGFRLLEKHKIKIKNNDIIKFKKLKWSITPRKLSLKDYNYQFYKKELKSLLGLVNFAIQVNSKYSKYKYLLDKSLVFI